MSLRYEKRARKFLGTRRWGAGNIKNRRGSGSRGGVGRAGKKHKFTRIVKYERERMSKSGFTPWHKSKQNVVNLDYVEAAAGGKGEIELREYKILGGGSISKPIKITAGGFSKSAQEKIKSAGGEAIQV
ncbi:MAG: uL15 family ribosomal protein [Candidatus Marsarchaeota archaeon]|nr:uL15 family ribosomal protein [Candidatus Marsarchaeota archaeon]MCL5412802.1 uL15 family ribosomal protein [Candidatus Marsarchaeota archaeon]